MTYYVALDVGVRTLALCIIDEDGEVQLERSLPSDVEPIVNRNKYWRRDRDFLLKSLNLLMFKLLSYSCSSPNVTTLCNTCNTLGRTLFIPESATGTVLRTDLDIPGHRMYSIQSFQQNCTVSLFS